MKQQALSVTALNRMVAESLRATFAGRQLVAGELMGFKAYPSGHWYFSLKDERASVRCVMFRGDNRGIAAPNNGDRLLLHAEVRLYEAQGSYQLVVKKLEAEGGAGALIQEFNRIKKTLEAEGLFAAERKRALPRYPRVVGVVSSAEGAVWHDIRDVMGRRAPNVRLVLYPSAVQGQGAPEQLRRALADAVADKRGPELVIIGRGGGSDEELWGFNDEALARAIADCPLPVVSAVGHETDFSICDFVADRRAATPSVAAEIASEGWVAAAALVAALQKRLRTPAQLVESGAQRLDGMAMRLQSAAARALADAHHRLAMTRQRFAARHPSQTLELASMELRRLAERLHAISPRAVLERGYAILTDADGAAITASGQTAQGQQLQAMLAHGRLALRVDKKLE